MKFSIRLEVQDSAGKAMVQGGVTLDNPSADEIRAELSACGERAIGFAMAQAEDERQAK